MLIDIECVPSDMNNDKGILSDTVLFERVGVPVESVTITADCV